MEPKKVETTLGALEGLFQLAAESDLYDSSRWEGFYKDLLEVTEALLRNDVNKVYTYRTTYDLVDFREHIQQHLKERGE